MLQNVQQDAIPAGHTAAYYYVGLSPATAFSTALPFGLTYRQQNAWMYEGGGLEMMRDFYADRFGVINFPAGNTGVQMGGWFNKEINSAADLEGLRMRIPGLGGRVIERLGVTVQLLPGGEIFQALQTGAIDATEWVGPYDDTTMGFQQVARYYYYPGWWEPGPQVDLFLPLSRWNELPEEYQAIVEAAAYGANAHHDGSLRRQEPGFAGRDTAIGYRGASLPRRRDAGGRGRRLRGCSTRRRPRTTTSPPSTPRGRISARPSPSGTALPRRPWSAGPVGPGNRLPIDMPWEGRAVRGDFAPFGRGEERRDTWMEGPDGTAPAGAGAQPTTLGSQVTVAGKTITSTRETPWSTMKGRAPRWMSTVLTSGGATLWR